MEISIWHTQIHCIEITIPVFSLVPFTHFPVCISSFAFSHHLLIRYLSVAPNLRVFYLEHSISNHNQTSLGNSKNSTKYLYALFRSLSGQANQSMKWMKRIGIGQRNEGSSNSIWNFEHDRHSRFLNRLRNFHISKRFRNTSSVFQKKLQFFLIE